MMLIVKHLFIWFIVCVCVCECVYEDDFNVLKLMM